MCGIPAHVMGELRGRAHALPLLSSCSFQCPTWGWAACGCACRLRAEAGVGTAAGERTGEVMVLEPFWKDPRDRSAHACAPAPAGQGPHERETSRKIQLESADLGKVARDPGVGDRAGAGSRPPFPHALKELWSCLASWAKGRALRNSDTCSALTGLAPWALVIAAEIISCGWFFVLQLLFRT